MTYPDEKNFEALWVAAADHCAAQLPAAPEQIQRIALWRSQEFHNWLRWRMCRMGFDWSKPGVLVLNAAGFAALVAYGFKSGNFHITAGGIVAWFTLVNLSFFTYFGLTLPGPPQALPEIRAEKGARFRAELGLYPAGYERRKLARVRLRIKRADGSTLRFELAFAKLPAHLQSLVEQQSQWRMQRADAPLTRAIVQSTGAARAQINAGDLPFEIVAFSWDEKSLQIFERG